MFVQLLFLTLTMNLGVNILDFLCVTLVEYEVVSEYKGEEYVTEEALAEFKEKEIDYVKSYTYNLAEFEGKTTSNNNKIIDLKMNTGTMTGGYYWVSCTVDLCAFEQAGDNPVRCLATSPFKPAFDSSNNLAGLTDPKSIIDVCCVLVDGSILSFTHTAKSVVENGVFSKSKFETNSSAYQGETRVSHFIGEMCLYTQDQEFANTFFEEYNAVVENGYIKDVVLYYQNKPEIENVDAHYLGGDSVG